MFHVTHCGHDIHQLLKTKSAVDYNDPVINTTYKLIMFIGITGADNIIETPVIIAREIKQHHKLHPPE